MSATYTYPGVYVEELQSPVHSITGVATSIAAFVGFTARGIDNRAQAIYSFADYQRLYGGLASNSEVSYAVQQFFLNGGSQAFVVRTPMHYGSGAGVVQYAKVQIGSGELTFTALSSGVWANGQLLVDVDVAGLDLSSTGDSLAFNLTITNLADGTTESFPAVSLNAAQQNYIERVVNDPDNGSQLVSVKATLPSPPVALHATGIVGTALSITGAGGVNALLGGGTPVATADANLTISWPGGPATAPTIKVIGNGAPIAQTVSGLAAQLQQALNTWLMVNVPGASAAVTVTGSGSSSALRVNVTIPNQPDVMITFGSPATGSDAATALGLKTSAYSNVAHYALGTSTTNAGLGLTSTPGTAPSGLPQSTELIGDPLSFSGIYALLKVDMFNLLCIPEAARASASDPNTLDSGIDALQIYSAAVALCKQRRAMLLVDTPPNVRTVAGAVDWKSNTLGITDPNGAAFFPRLRLADPQNKGQLRTFAPSGVVAGVFANTDATRGVWKAPAGINASLNGVQSMTYKLSDQENGALNPLGLNCFRTFPLYGNVLWGSRTLAGADAMTSQWKYIPVRRTALFLEESLYRGLKWVVFEPNDEPLWAAIRLNVGSFMDSLFKKGAFQGITAKDAYFVKCDSETTTQTDIDNGIVNVLVGFAPLKPAEFVVIQIEQLTAQASA